MARLLVHAKNVAAAVGMASRIIPCIVLGMVAHMPCIRVTIVCSGVVSVVSCEVAEAKKGERKRRYSAPPITANSANTAIVFIMLLLPKA